MLANVIEQKIKILEEQKAVIKSIVGKALDDMFREYLCSNNINITNEASEKERIDTIERIFKAESRSMLEGEAVANIDREIEELKRLL